MLPFTLQNKENCLKCSEYFLVNELKVECGKYLIECTCISSNTIFFILLADYTYLLKTVIDKCLQFIDSNIEIILSDNYE